MQKVAPLWWGRDHITKSHKSLKMNELRGAAGPPPVSVKKKMRFCETFFSAKNDFFCCVFGGICYLTYMNETQLTPAEDLELTNALMERAEMGMRSGWGSAIKWFEQWQEKFNTKVAARIAAENK
jgi:hypothetical protein